ncbi:hypothetical protein BDZ45DRAFT_730548 [Acephala macrosclerotiorum]|nr:hypothetical protein BDZ45DRAFT_730548 [Acephala macrosclerotiorum]
MGSKPGKRERARLKALGLRKPDTALPLSQRPPPDPSDEAAVKQRLMAEKRARKKKRQKLRKHQHQHQHNDIEGEPTQEYSNDEAVLDIPLKDLNLLFRLKDNRLHGDVNVEATDGRKDNPQSQLFDLGVEAHVKGHYRALTDDFLPSRQSKTSIRDRSHPSTSLLGLPSSITLQNASLVIDIPPNSHILQPTTNPTSSDGPHSLHSGAGDAIKAQNSKAKIIGGNDHNIYSKASHLIDTAHDMLSSISKLSDSLASKTLAVEDTNLIASISAKDYSLRLQPARDICLGPNFEGTSNLVNEEVTDEKRELNRFVVVSGVGRTPESIPAVSFHGLNSSLEAWFDLEFDGRDVIDARISRIPFPLPSR